MKALQVHRRSLREVVTPRVNVLRIFTRSEIEEIRRVTLWDVIINATGISANSIQRNVFVWEGGDPCPQPYQLNSTMLEPCVPLQRYDYFEVIFILPAYLFSELYISPVPD